jgi:SAM-dependent MidA family methyltransferase
MLANEVLDALPCQRFVVQAGGELRELGVCVAERLPAQEGARLVAASLEEITFLERAALPDPVLAGACDALLHELPQPLPVGYTSEVCLRLEPWIAGVGGCLEQGALLLFDYGLPRSHYYHPQRVSGTLRCHFKQLAHDDPYINVGVQDITAWVDFTRVAEAAVAAGLDVAGFGTQAAFLLATGIESFAAEASGTVEHARRAGEARRLLMPGEMGEAFKVMALTRNYDAALGGFSLQDLRHSL